MRNAEVDSLNQGIRELLKAQGLLTGKEYRCYISNLKSMKIIWQEIVFYLRQLTKIYK